MASSDIFAMFEVTEATVLEEANAMEDPKRLLADWWNAGQTVALATVCDTWKSAPRNPGAIMVLGPDGEVTGSVSGGCVEGAVHESCVDALTTQAEPGSSTTA